MDSKAKLNRLAAVLYFVAASFAFIAFAIGFSSNGPLKWSTAAAGVFCASMGLMTWSRSGSPKP